ncbi:hypothetical protein L7F22_043067 [Adiantum nelumboides]|nr:hypothetical protein [Adiantum nelumboides]
MESPGSDDEKLRQEREAALSKKMKILIIMLSLLLMILLLPLASNHGLPLLRPMGNSLLQRLWDAMRFIAMTAAISVGIISTSNTNKNSKNSDSSSLYRSPTSSRSRRSMVSTASSSREAINPNTYSLNNMDRSGSFKRHTEPMPEGENGDFDETWKSIQVNSKEKYKGKEVSKDWPFSANFHSDMHFDSADASQSQCGSFEGADNEIFRQRPLKLSMVNSRRQWSAGDTWFLASRIDEEVEEDSTALSTRYESPSSRFHGGESSMSRADLQKSSLASRGMEGSTKENKTADKGLRNVYNAMTDDNYAELRIRKTAVSRLAEEYQDEKVKGHRRSSSVDRRQPMYMYDPKNPDQPGLKQILMEMSKERALKSKMSDSMATGDQSHQRVRERPTPAHIRISSKPGALASTSSVKQSIQANVQHHQASVLSTMEPPLDSTAIEKHADVKTVGISHTQQEALNMGTTESLQSKAVADKTGSNQRKHAPTSHEIGHKQGNINLSFDSKMQLKEGDHSQVRPMQRHVDAAKSNTQQNVSREGNYKAKVEIPLKHVDGKMGSTQTRNTEDYNLLLQVQNASKLPLKGANVQSHHGFGEGNYPPQKGNMSSTSRLLKQSSQHSRSALNLEQLGQADQIKHQANPPVRSRKSISYDFGDGFNPDWLLELEPPPPPGLLGSFKVEDHQSTDSVRVTDNSALVQSLVPWRSSAPIDISAYPRAASPLEALSSEATGPSPGEVNRRADEFISNFTTRLIRQRKQD